MEPVKEVQLPAILGHRRLSVSAAAAIVACALLTLVFVVAGIIKGFSILVFPILIACGIVGLAIALIIGPFLNRLIYRTPAQDDWREDSQ